MGDKGRLQGEAFEGGKIFERCTRHSHPREKGPRPAFLSLAPKKGLLARPGAEINGPVPAGLLSHCHQFNIMLIVARLRELLPGLFRRRSPDS